MFIQALPDSIYRRSFPGLLARKAIDFGDRRTDRLRSRLVIRKLKTLDPPGSHRHWHIGETRWTLGRSSVVSIGRSDSSSDRVILKFAHSPEGAASLRQQLLAQSTLRRDPRLAGWSNYVPEPLMDGTVLGRYFLAEQEIPGKSADQFPLFARDIMNIQSQALAVISLLHQQTTHTEDVNHLLIDRWIRQRIRILRTALIVRSSEERLIDALDHLEAELICWMRNRQVRTGWIHGDFWLGNVLMENPAGTLTGIIDWDRSGPSELALHDIVHMTLLSKKLLSNQWGEQLLASMLDGEEVFSPDEVATVTAAHADLGTGPEAKRVALFLYWLRHTANTVTRLPSIIHNPDYIRDNLTLVLKRVIH